LLLFLLGYNLRHKLAKAVAWSCIKVRWLNKVKNTEKLRRTSVAAMPHQLKTKRKKKKYKAALGIREI
jgi:hypothetical protein